MFFTALLSENLLQYALFLSQLETQELLKLIIQTLHFISYKSTKNMMLKHTKSLDEFIVARDVDDQIVVLLL